MIKYIVAIFTVLFSFFSFSRLKQETKKNKELEVEVKTSQEEVAKIKEDIKHAQEVKTETDTSSSDDVINELRNDWQRD